MNDYVSPKQVSRAIRVSESSVKRWCDKGVIPTRKTAGGHRRIPLAGLLEFLRESGQPLVQPEMIGLPAATGQMTHAVDGAASPFTEALLRGDYEDCRQIILDLFLAEHSLSSLCDQVFARAFEAIGRRWECGEAAIYQERRGCEIALRILHQVNSLLPPPLPDAPLAIGGALEGDQYSLGTTMAELVLRDAKWNSVSLGNNLPFATMAQAIQDQRPRMLWLSCSYIDNESHFLRQYADLYDQFGLDVAFVVGGRALIDPVRRRMRYTAYCDNMQHLEAVAHTLQRETGVSDRTA